MTRFLTVILIVHIVLSLTACADAVKWASGEDETESGTEAVSPGELRQEQYDAFMVKYRNEIGATEAGKRIVIKTEAGMTVEFDIYDFDDRGYIKSCIAFAYDSDVFKQFLDRRSLGANMDEEETRVDDELQVCVLRTEYVWYERNAYNYFRSVILESVDGVDEAERVDALEKGIIRDDGSRYSSVGRLSYYEEPVPELRIDSEGYAICPEDARYYDCYEVGDGVCVSGYEAPVTGSKLIIPGDIDGKKVVRVGRLHPVEGVTCVEIAPGVRELRDSFKGWEKLDRLILHDGIERLGGETVAGTGVKSVDIPESVVFIGDGFFKGMDVGDVTEFYPNISKINGMYSGSGIHTIVIPETVETVERDAFKDCNALEVVVIKEGVSVIEEGSFFRCKNLQAVSLPASAKVISNGAFTTSVMLIVPEDSYAESWCALNCKNYVCQ